MSEQAAEAPARNPARGKENVFTHKIGPLPMWVWLLISLGILLGWAYYKNRTTSSSPSSSANASQVPQFVNQTYTTVNPPTSPNPRPPYPPNTHPQDHDTDEGHDTDDQGDGNKKCPRKSVKAHSKANRIGVICRSE